MSLGGVISRCRGGGGMRERLGQAACLKFRLKEGRGTAGAEGG